MKWCLLTRRIATFDGWWILSSELL
jgi:hypothetical protein